MSIVKKRWFYIVLISVFVALFSFGCKIKNPAESISFDTSMYNGNVVMLVGETYTPKIEVLPTFASDKSYYLTSSNENVVRVSNNSVVAVGEGQTYIKAISNDNKDIETSVLVVVYSQSVQLAPIEDLEYDNKTQTFSFGDVAGAVGYTLFINEREINIGNTTTYSLQDCETFFKLHNFGSVYNSVLNVKARANAPEFTRALVSSNIDNSNEIKFYQTEAVKNVKIKTNEANQSVLTFAHEQSNSFNIILNGRPWKNTQEKSVTLMDLPADYANSMVNLQINALINEAIYANYSAIGGEGADVFTSGDNVTYYSSYSENYEIFVYGNPHVEIEAVTAKWQSMGGVENYKITVGEHQVTQAENYLDLLNFATENELQPSTNLNLVVEPVLVGENIAKAEQSQPTKFNILSAPEINVVGTTVSWSEVGKLYFITLYDDDADTEILSTSVLKTSYDLSGQYSAHNLSFYVGALGYYDEASEVHFINSAQNKVNVKGNETPNIEVADYTLKIDITNGEQYQILFDGAARDELFDVQFDNAVYDKDKHILTTSQEGRISIDLKKTSFDAGEHEITVVQLGRQTGLNSFSLDSSKAFHKFLQLEKVENLEIIEGIASATLSETNSKENATIYFEILETDKTNLGTISGNKIEYAINTTNDEEQDFLTSGEYTIVIRLGDGSTSFGCVENGEIVANATKQFTVLPVPKMNLKDGAIANLELDSEQTKFKIYSSQNNDTFEEFKTIEENNFDFELELGEIYFKAQAIGDGTNTLNSAISASTKIEKLKSPLLVYNKLSGFTITDENDVAKVLNYSINQDTCTKETISSFKPNFTVGNNEFSIVANANNGSAENEFYLNSNAFVLNVNKIDAKSNITLEQDENFELATNGNYFNHIKIAPQNLEQEYKLILKIKIGEKSFEFTSLNGNLVSSENDYVLPYVYAEGCYYIALLGNDYLPIISEMKNESENSLNFSLTLVFDSDENNTASSLEEVKELLILPRTTLSRNEQDITAENVVQSYNFSGYALYVNNKIIHLDDALATQRDGKFYFPFTSLESLLEQNEILLQDDEVLSIQFITQNLNNLGLCAVSENFYLLRASAVALSLTKNVSDKSANNALTISFNALDNAYAENVKYTASAYNLLDSNKINVISTTRTNTDKNENGIISFGLEDIIGYENLSNAIYLEVYVLCAANYTNGNTINVFNSHASKTLTISKLAQVTNLFVGATQENDKIINEGYLQFSCENLNSVAYFEIWNLSANTKLGTTTNTYYNIDALTASANLAVKAISVLEYDNINYSNSNFSQSVQATKINISSSIDSGDFCLDVPLLSSLKELIESGNIYIEISNSSLKDLILIDYDNATDVEFDYKQNKIIIGASRVLVYGDKSLVQEEVSFKLKTRLLNADGGVYYTNSNTITNSVKGLMRVENLSMSYVTNDGEFVDSISWQNSAVNNEGGLTFSYSIKLIYEGETYTSRQGKFYYNDDVINETATVNSSSINLPTRFEADGISVAFSSGKYQLFIKAVANSTQNYAASRFVQTDIDILPAPTLSMVNGHIEWDEQPYAQGYAVRIIKGENEKVITSQETTNKFDFMLNELQDIDGVLAVQVQAVGNIKNEMDEQVLHNTLSSRWSEKFYVYKLPKLADAAARINDGTLVLNANKFISGVEVQFVSENYSKVISFDREADEAIQQDLAALSITSWDTASSQALEGVQKDKHIIFKDAGSEVLNLPEGVQFTINVRLLGNTSTSGGLPIVSSGITQNASNLKAVKMELAKASANNLGEFSFGENSTSTATDVNYNINDEETIDENVVNSKIFKIDLSIKNIGDVADQNVVIYALDYNYFYSNIEQQNLTDLFTKYDEGYGGLYACYKLNRNGTQLYLNVYKNNTLNFKTDKLWYHEILVEENDGEYIYSMPSEEAKSIDITLGGAFAINAHLLGGDSEQAEKSYLTSNASEKRFIRYNLGTLLANNGEIKFKDARTESGIEDNPIYKIVATSPNNDLSKTFYLYYTLEEEAKHITQNADGVYVKIEKIDNQNFVLFNISQYLESSSYEITIQTLAGMGSTDGENYLLNSYTSLEKTFYKLSNTKFEAETTAGVRLNLTFLQNATNSTISNTDRFEITLTESENVYVYEIDKFSEGVLNLNGKYVYTLPSKIVVDGEDVLIDTNKTYNLKIRALAPASESENLLLNGSYCNDTIDVKKAEAVLQTKIANGKIMFKKPAGYENSILSIQISYLIDDNLFKTITISNACKNEGDNWFSYEIDDYNYPVDGAGSELIMGKIDYFVKAYVYGSIPSSSSYCVLNSDYSTALPMNRLQQVDSSTIIAEDGVLTWQPNTEIIEREGETNSATGYKIVLTQGDDNLEFLTNAEQTSYDLSQIQAGKYQVSVRALGDKLINSINAQAEYTFIKLNAVNNDSFEMTDHGRTLNWQAVDDLTNYQQEFVGQEFSVGYKVKIKYGVNSIYETFVTTASCSLPATISGEFVVEVQTTAQGRCNLLASEIAQATLSLSRPDNPITRILYDENLASFYFDIDSSLYVGDTIVITYAYKEYLYDEETLSQTDSFNSQEIRYKGEARYYFTPDIMGMYTSISVAIEREGGGYSSSIYYNIGSGFNLNIFGAGNGQDKPYKIYSEQELLNIYKRPNANFVLQDDITLTASNLPVRLSASKDGENKYSGVLANVFGGSLDGNSKTISAGEINLTNQNFALFGTIKGDNSTIKSLTLNNFNLHLSATDNNQDIALAIIANEANGATLQNIEATNITINAAGTNGAGMAKNVYLAGLINISTNTNLLGCHIEVSFEYNVNANSDKYIGGLVSSANGGKISSNQGRDNILTTTINVDKNLSMPITYLGGAVGKFDAAENCTIENTTITLTATNIKAQYFGGVIGFANNATIQNCQVSTNSAITAVVGETDNRFDTRFGGIVGYASASTITGCGVDLSVSINVGSGALSRYVYLGIIAGELNSSSVQNCTSKQAFENGKTELKVGTMTTLGVYGNNSNSTVGEVSQN